MKKLLMICAFSLSLTNMAVAEMIDTTAEWECIGPDGGGVYSMTESNGTLYAGGRYICYSDDRGVQWNKYENVPFIIGPPFASFYEVAAKGDTLFGVFGRNDSILWRSTDDGATWDNIFRFENPYTSGDAAPRIFDAIGGIMFFRIGGNFLRSSDGGDTWDTLGTTSGVPSNFNPHVVVHFGDTIIVAGYNKNPQNNTSASAIRSMDKGESWEVVGTGITGMNVNALTASKNLVFAGTNDGVFKSTDRGENWELLDENLDHITALETYGDYLLCGRRYGLYFSTDDGISWSRISIDPMFDDTSGSGFFLKIGAYSRVGVIKSTQNGDVFVSVSGTGFLYKSSGNLQQWTHCKNGIGPYRRIIQISAYKDSLYATDNWGRIHRTSDNGTTWDYLAYFAGIKQVKSIHRSDNYFVIGGEVFRSLDGGNTWSDFSKGASLGPIYSFAEIDDTLFAGSDTTIYRLEKENGHWIEIPGNHSQPIISNKGRLFAGPALSTSDDYGQTWENITTFPIEHVDSAFTAIAAYDNLVFAAKRTGEMFVSEDNGDSWDMKQCPKGIQISNIGQVFPNSNRLLVATGRMVFAGTADSGVYVSFDTAQTWYPINKGIGPNAFGEVEIMSLTIQEEKYLYVATFDAIYMIDIDPDPSGSYRFNRQQLKKQPFTIVPAGRNAFRLITAPSNQGNVKVTLFDLQGRQLFHRVFHTSGKSVLHIPIPMKAKGMCILEIVTPDGNFRVPINGYK